jgi:hypothetical protein
MLKVCRRAKCVDEINLELEFVLIRVMHLLLVTTSEIELT